MRNTTNFLIAALIALSNVQARAASLARQDTEQIDLPILQSQPFRIPDTLTIRVQYKYLSTLKPLLFGKLTVIFSLAI